MGAAESTPEPPPQPKPLEDMTIDELRIVLQQLRDRVAKLVENTEVLRTECIKGERMLAVLRSAQRAKDKALLGQGSDIRTLR